MPEIQDNLKVVAANLDRVRCAGFAGNVFYLKSFIFYCLHVVHDPLRVTRTVCLQAFHADLMPEIQDNLKVVAANLNRVRCAGFAGNVFCLRSCIFYCLHVVHDP
jgi:hypothetical protein